MEVVSIGVNERDEDLKYLENADAQNLPKPAKNDDELGKGKE